MDNTILEVVIGLVLIYAVLALLVMKVQEEMLGNFFHYRVGTLHDMLLEATGQDETLKKQILENPLVFALYAGQDAKKTPGWRDKGPTRIPADLFTRALLAELNGKVHPASSFATPSAFVAAKTPKDGNSTRIWQTLATLLPGREANWADFEAAIGRWYDDIGNRADGWFKRKASGRTWVFALVVIALLNVDSFHIANALSSDSALRVGLADLAARVDVLARAERDGKGAEPLPAAPASLAAQPMVQLVSRMNDAIVRLNDAFLRDRGVNSFRADLAPIEDRCTAVEDKDYLTRAEQAAKEKDKDNLTPAERAASQADTKSLKFGADSMLGNSDVWVRVLPLVLAKVEAAQLKPADKATETYKKAFKCIAQVSAWVRSATMVSNTASVRTSMQEASVALEGAKSALLTLINNRQASASIRRMYLAEPQAFEDCSRESGSRTEFDACMKRELSATLRLPMFHGGAASREQHCEAVFTKVGQPDRASKAGTGSCNQHFPGNAALGLPEMHLANQGLTTLLFVAAGWFATAIFVSLGAPFWFDLLSKVVKLRSAGSARDEAADALKGRGTLPLPSTGGGAAVPPPPPPSPGTGPFASTRNLFEDKLLPADMVRLQQRLGIDQTGRLDTPTRNAIKAWCQANAWEPATDELSQTLYTRIVGRAATQSAPAGAVSRPRVGERSEFVSGLVTVLGPALGMPQRVSPTETVFTPDLRALAVLFRYKQERAAETLPKDCKVMNLPTRNPAALDEVDDVLMAEIESAGAQKKTFAPEVPAWMDWAIGELGQVEIDARTRAASNPRILEYLDTAVAGAGNDGDHTPWCGAFVAWVLAKYIATLPAGHAGRAAAAIVKAPLAAANWDQWGTGPRASTGAAVFGDVVVFKPMSGTTTGHVAFFVAEAAGSVWVLGGNQSSGSRVSLTSFQGDRVRVIRHV